jgi:hypothetical protein
MICITIRENMDKSLKILLKNKRLIKTHRSAIVESQFTHIQMRIRLTFENIFEDLNSIFYNQSFFDAFYE